MDHGSSTCAIVIIGRNEGERLKRCLRSLPVESARVYVDSGSTDGSQGFARSIGIDVVELDPGPGFTAGRARNAGLSAIRAAGNPAAFVQMIDGDCELDPAWIAAGQSALAAHPELACVFGRLRERFPDASLYNRQCDDEWNVPVGEVASCGGIAMFRLGALDAVGGYADDLIAGEEPDLCLRLAQKGWKIRRIDAEMALHDAALIHFSQWWRRARRSGHAYAEHVWRHGKAAFPSWRRQWLSIMFWGLALPLAAATCFTGWAAGGWPSWPWLLLLAIYPAQIARIALRSAKGLGNATLTVVGKFAELSGAVRFYLNVARGGEPTTGAYEKRS